MFTAKYLVTSTLSILAVAQVLTVAPTNAQVAQKPASHPVIEKLTTAPSDFPVSPYERNLVGTTVYHHNASAAAGQSVSAFTKTQDDPGTVFEWYQAQLKSGGWTVTLPKAANAPQSQLEGKMFQLKAAHGRTEVMVTCTKLYSPCTTVTVTAYTN